MNRSLKNIDWQAVEKNLNRSKELMTPEERQAILDVIRLPLLRDVLVHDVQATDLLRNIAEAQTAGKLLIDRLRKLAMSIWLDHINTSAIDESGKILVRIQGQALNIDQQLVNQRNARYRQAIIRQIEREVVMDECGLFDLENVSNRSMRLLDVGAGSCINSVMMRNKYPNMEITAVDPGVLTPKIREIVTRKEINYIRGEIDDVNEKDSDVINLQFVLEHDLKSSKDILRTAIRKIADGGMISIAVPNFNAFHRELEVAIGKNKRDPVSRLSELDHLVGHQIIFTRNQLMEIIETVMREEKVELPTFSKTILPRPFSFNTLIALKEQETLWQLHVAGHIPGMEEMGSVICINIGQEPNSTLPKAPHPQTTQKLFQKILYKQVFHDIKKADKEKEVMKLIDYLYEHYPILISESDIARLAQSSPYRSRIWGILR